MNERENQEIDDLSDSFLQAPLIVVNVGLAGFAEDLEASGVEVLHVEWRPVAGGDPDLAALLAEMGA